ncbi:MAG: efflux RND transporter permease subunit, partial [Hyphomicrobiales bacterium]|nr:efflux RND transporter permease subunit [Hyphomicrobiales bacterium]
MSVSRPFILRPIATSLLAIALLMIGVLGYRGLPVSSLPQVDFPTIVVTTQYPGANPDTMVSLVTAPLERNFGQIPSLTAMSSVSSYGLSKVTLQFDLSRNIDDAAQDVQAAINASAATLPRTLPYPPTYAKVNPADAPILTFALTSDTASLRQLSDVADTLIAPRLSQVSGVGGAEIEGGVKPAVRIEADLGKLASLGLGLESLRATIQAANVAGSKGAIDGARQAYAIAANDQIASAAEYEKIVVAFKNGAPTTLGDVAQVVDGLEDERVGGWLDGKPAVIVDVRRQPGANVVATVDRAKAEAADLVRALPAGVKLEVVQDRTVTIRASIRDVETTLAT